MEANELNELRIKEAEEVNVNYVIQRSGTQEHVRPTTIEEIRIFPIDAGGEYKEGKFGYYPVHFGQGAYILERCKEEGMSAKYNGGRIEIFAITKLIFFRKIIFESFKFEDLNDVFIFKKHVTYTDGRTFIGTYIKETDTMYTTESRLPQVVSCIFQKKMPRPSIFKLFNTKTELIEHLVTEENLLVN